ncbi:MAG: V-type ATPase 116kDa subunit family protein, partial [Oscillospiraceae bacterium]
LDEAKDYLNGLSSRVTDIKEEKEEKTLLIKNNEVVGEQLSHFAAFNVELHDLFTMKYLKFHFGRIPNETYRDCLKIIDERPDVYFLTSGRDDHWTYGAYFALPEAYGKIEAIFSSMGFERIRIDVKGSVEDTANEVMKRLEKERADAAERIKALDEELSAIKQTESEKLLLRYSWLKYENDSFDILTYAGRRHGKFYIIGWIPKSISEKYAEECEAFRGFACFLTDPKEIRSNPPPVKFKRGFLSDIYQPYLEMYGLPAYGEIDPRLFLGITYTVIFGIMFGDVGQGLSLAVLGLLLWRMKKVWLGRIVGLCGLSATAFGFVYGSVFGNEELFPWGFKVLEDGNTIKILLIAVVIGAALLMICMIMNIINGIRQNDLKKIFFSPNGVVGFVFYMGIAVGVIFKTVLGKDIFTAPFIIGVIAIPLFLIFAATPLTNLIKGEKEWMPESVGMFFVEGFFEMFETLLSYVSNTVSFLRVGAFAISHAGMMMVVYMLSSGAGGSHSIGGLIFGNIFVTGLEAMLVCIQVLRLEYYEMFGRFYQGGGIKFSPKIINYKAVEQ